MKKRLLFLFIPLLLITGCSSIPKKARITPVIVQKEKASLYLDRGHNEYRWDNFPSALHMYSSAFSTASTVDWQDGMIRALVHLSRTNDRMKKAELSKEYLDRASDLMMNNNSVELSALIMNRKTEWLLFNDTPEAALKENDSTLEYIKSLTSEDAGETWRIRASILKSMKSYDLALESINKALDLDVKGNFVSETASDFYIKASVYSLKGDKARAVESMESALEKDKYIENTPGIAQDLYALGLIYEKTGDIENATHYFYRSYLVYSGYGKDRIPEKLLLKVKESSDNPWHSVVDEY